MSPQGFPSEKNYPIPGRSSFAPAVHRATIYCRPRGCSGETYGEAAPRAGQACPLGRWPQRRITGMVPPIPPVRIHGTATSRPRCHITPAGLMFLAITSIGWGFNWPVTKYLLSELPPLTLRGGTGVVGAGLLALLALLRGQSLHVPRELWPRLCLAAFLNVACWMVLMGLALLWLPGERSRADRLHHAGMGLADGMADPRRAAESVARDLAGHGVRRADRHHGRRRHLPPARRSCRASSWCSAARSAFAVGTVLAKKLPLPLPPMTAAAWQIGIGCLPVAIVGAVGRKHRSGGADQGSAGSCWSIRP